MEVNQPILAGRFSLSIEDISGLAGFANRVLAGLLLT
jgi:hypothetical protein